MIYIPVPTLFGMMLIPSTPPVPPSIAVVALVQAQGRDGVVTVARGRDGVVTVARGRDGVVTTVKGR